MRYASAATASSLINFIRTTSQNALGLLYGRRMLCVSAGNVIAANAMPTRIRAMRDPRLEKLADVLVNYSVGVKPGQFVRLSGPPCSQPLVVELYRKVLSAGGHPHVRIVPEELTEIILKNGTEAQLKFLIPIHLHEYEII